MALGVPDGTEAGLVGEVAVVLDYVDPAAPPPHSQQTSLASITPDHCPGSSEVVIAAYIPLDEEDTSRPHPDWTSHNDCEQCSQGYRYHALKDAVKHLHDEHFHCIRSSSQVNFMEDPCLGWVRETETSRSKPYDYGVISIVEEFLNFIRGIREKTRDLHLSVTGMSENSDNTNLRPHLLANLVQSFEEIICRYVLAAKELSWTNRARMNISEDRINPDLLKMTRRWCGQAEHDINELLNLAKRDIILLGTTKHEIDRLIIAPIGPEFFLASILSNIQNNTIVQVRRTFRPEGQELLLLPSEYRLLNPRIALSSGAWRNFQ